MIEILNYFNVIFERIPNVIFVGIINEVLILFQLRNFQRLTVLFNYE